MRYIDHVVQPGETVRLVTTVSWVGYLPALALWVAAALLAAAVPSSSGFVMVARILALVMVAGGVVLAAHAWWRRWTTEVAVTDRRIVYKTGFINRHTIEMHMDKVESVDVDQSIVGRLLNYGDITIRGTGETMERLHNIDRPLEFRNCVTAA